MIKKSVKKSPPKRRTAGKEAPPKYHEGVGRRKTAVARVRIWPARNAGASVAGGPAKAMEITVNNRDFAIYFKEKGLQDVFIAPLLKINESALRISSRIKGGGLRAQAEAGRHGLSRALILYRPEFRTVLKTLGFLTRDSRMKERKKPGLKGARRAPQWSKR